MSPVSSILAFCKPRFQAGRLAMTEAVTHLVAQRQLNVMRYLARHLHCNWGDVSPEQAQANRRALREPQALTSLYKIAPNLTLSIVTAPDRSVTTASLADERGAHRSG